MHELKQEKTMMKVKPGMTAACVATAVSIAGFTGCSNPATPSQAAAVTRSVGTALDDNVITAQVKSKLIADPGVKGFDFKVDTRKGEVQLSGYVDDQTQIDRAIAIARHVEGVNSVDNRVSLKVGVASIGNQIDDSIVTASVKSALLADNDVRGLQIGVVTRKGIVQLSGYVDNQGQSGHAVAIASTTDGVQGVNNEMSIKQ
jgi:hyperosmotically inducible protein